MGMTIPNFVNDLNFYILSTFTLTLLKNIIYYVYFTMLTNMYLLNILILHF